MPQAPVDPMIAVVTTGVRFTGAVAPFHATDLDHSTIEEFHLDNETFTR